MLMSSKGFTGGTSNNDAFDGALLADREDVVIVTLKYLAPLLAKYRD